MRYLDITFSQPFTYYLEKIFFNRSKTIYRTTILTMRSMGRVAGTKNTNNWYPETSTGAATSFTTTHGADTCIYSVWSRSRPSRTTCRGTTISCIHWPTEQMWWTIRIILLMLCNGPSSTWTIRNSIKYLLVGFLLLIWVALFDDFSYRGILYICV